MAQYPIPQYIEAEGKIINFLTFRQFFILIGGGAVCVVLYNILPFSFFVVVAVIVIALTALLAFVKVNNVSIITIFLQFLGFLSVPKNYVWKKKEIAHPFIIKKGTDADVPGISEIKSQITRLQDTKKKIEIGKK